jgi:hypothetical protein
MSILRIICRAVAMLVAFAILAIFFFGLMISLHEPGSHTIFQWGLGLAIWSLPLGFAFWLIFRGFRR